MKKIFLTRFSKTIALILIVSCFLLFTQVLEAQTTSTANQDSPGLGTVGTILVIIGGLAVTALMAIILFMPGGNGGDENMTTEEKIKKQEEEYIRKEKE